MAYFHPWVIAEEDAMEHVPVVMNLARGKDGKSMTWREACTTWLAGHVLSQEMKHIIQNFFAVTRARPNDKEVERNQSDEEVSDEDLDVNAHDLEELLLTTPGGRKGTVTRRADDHHENALAGIAHVRNRWANTAHAQRRGIATALPNSMLNTGDMLAAAAALRREGEEEMNVQAYVTNASAGKIEMRRRVKWADIQDWLRVNVECGGVSASQGNFVREVARRFFVEPCEEGRVHGYTTEPLRKLVHGKPGTGKSSKCMALATKFFDEIGKYKKGVHYHVCTLQAFLAAVLGGHTMHHLAGINPFHVKRMDDDDTGVSHESVQTRFLLARWVLIDELFMSSAQFSAEFECALRNAVPAASCFRNNKWGVRPFGGLNILGFGDAYQLDCPEGTPLYKIPTAVLGDAAAKEDSPLIARGLALLWDQEEGQGFQSVLDLTEPFRCTDPWWNSVLDEFRFLQLTTDTHSFLAWA